MRQIQKENKILTSKSNNVAKPSEQLAEQQNIERTNQPDMLNKIFEERYKWALKQKEEVEKEKNKIVHRLIKFKERIGELKAELDQLKEKYHSETQEVGVTIKRVMKVISNARRDAKKANNSRPKAPIIDLPKIFEDHIKVLKFNVDHSAIGLKCVVQPQAWACSIINLIYIEKTK